MRTAIIIPAYNESKTVSSVVKRAKRHGTVIVINDASKDDTASVARKAGALVISHKINRGLGAALRTGFKKAIDSKYDVIVTIDADGQHDPDEIPKFVEKINQDYDFVIGARDLSEYPFVKKFGNFWLNLLTNIVAGTNIKDTESGFRAFRTGALKKLNLSSERYQIAAEIIYEIGKNKLRCASVPVSSPLYRKGVGVMDGVKNFLYILRK